MPTELIQITHMYYQYTVNHFLRNIDINTSIKIFEKMHEL